MDFSLATASWAQGIFGELYTLDPFKYTIDAIKAGTANVDVSKEKLADLEREFPNHMPVILVHVSLTQKFPFGLVLQMHGFAHNGHSNILSAS